MRKLISLLLLLVFAMVTNHIFASNFSHTAYSSKPFMIEFSNDSESKYWRTTNDNVMGGISTGGIIFNESDATFSGSISTENNGGFSSIYRVIPALKPNLDAVEIDILGDGLTYQLRFMVFTDGYQLSYKHEFETTTGLRQTLSLPLKDFDATFRGRIIYDAPELRSQDIHLVGFLVTSKSATPFSLTLYELRMLTAFKAI